MQYYSVVNKVNYMIISIHVMSNFISISHFNYVLVLSKAPTYFAWTWQHWNGHDMRTRDEFLKMHITRASNTFQTQHGSMIEVYVLHRLKPLIFIYTPMTNSDLLRLSLYLKYCYYFDILVSSDRKWWKDISLLIYGIVGNSKQWSAYYTKNRTY